MGVRRRPVHLCIGATDAALAGVQVANLKGQNLINLLVGQRLGYAARRVLSIPYVALARPVIRDILVPELERHLPTCHCRSLAALEFLTSKDIWSPFVDSFRPE